MTEKGDKITPTLDLFLGRDCETGSEEARLMGCDNTMQSI